MKENKLINAIEPSILLSVLSRTHEFFNKKIKPSRNDLEMLFALHGKNLNEYQK
jgi:hypothetical protein